jgi:hypothetical protein
MQVLLNGGFSKASGKPRQSPHAQVRYGVRVANLKALTAAEFYLNKVANKEPVTLKETALRHGTNVVYLRAAITVLKATDPFWIDCLLDDDDGCPILELAKLLAPQVKVIEALKAANPANLQAIYTATGFTNELAKLLAKSSSTERTDAARAFGHVDAIWADMVDPLISAAE